MTAETVCRVLLLACFVTGAFGMMQDPRSGLHTLLMDLCILTGGAGMAALLLVGASTA